MIDRILAADEPVRASARFTERVMTGVRAAARPSSSPVFAWRWFVLKLATGLSLAVTVILVAEVIDFSVLAPVAGELTAAGAIPLALLAALRLPQFFADAG